MILSIPALLLFFTLLTGISRNIRQNFKPKEEFRRNAEAHQQVDSEKMMNLTAFGEKLERLRFADSNRSGLVKITFGDKTSANNLADLQAPICNHELLKISGVRLN